MCKQPFLYLACMELPGKVSVWAGHFADEAELEEYTSVYYKNEDDDGSAIIWSDLGINWFDDDFQEVAYFEEAITADDLQAFSYAEIFMQHIKLDELKGYNALILLYDFQPEPGKDNSDLKYLGTFSYTR